MARTPRNGDTSLLRRLGRWLRRRRAPFQWHSQPMEPLVDLSDKDAVQAILDEEDIRRLRR